MTEEINYLDQSANKYIEETKKFLNQNKYISKKQYNRIIDKYQEIFNNLEHLDSDVLKKIKLISNNIGEIIVNHNSTYVNNCLITNKEYFDHMFDYIDSSIKLDEEQRKAIVIDEDYSLIIAGAGSGKTTTMAAKVKYLTEKCNVDPNKIIVMSFTRRATQELDDRINNDFKIGAHITTFHKLGMSILKNKYNHSLTVIGEPTKYNIIKDYIINNLFKDKKKLKKFNDVFFDYVYFDKKSCKYKTFDEYYNYYIKKKYREEKKDLKEFNRTKIEQRLNNLKTINGEQLRSKPEVKIANFLYECGIPYTYEKPYPQQLDNNVSYQPDFTIDNGFKTIYLEYYGLTEKGNNEIFSIDDIKYYNSLVEKKKKLHQKYGTNLIELFKNDYENKTMYQKLEQELKKYGTAFKEKSDKEIFIRLMETNKDGLIYQFINLAVTFITRFKEKNYQIEDIENLKQKTNDKNIVEQLDFMKTIIEYYNKTIHQRHQIDFEDMINYAYKMIENDRSLKNNYEYIIVDEYQDVSIQKYNLIKRLSDLFDAKIVAVGDDWQSIFGFSGSDVSLFTNFCDMMGYGEIIRITNTYRNSQELIDVAGEFISKNISQFQKNLTSNKHLNKPIELTYYDTEKKNEKSKIINEIIKEIYFKNHKSNILLIGRYNSDIDELLESKYFKLGNKEQSKIICKEIEQIDVTFLTIHSSKGLGFDNVIILNALDGTYGFPSKKKDEPLIDIFKDKEYEKNIPFPEERRLFYVALTRTKNKVYIMCPNKKISDFITEIKQNKNVTEKYYVL